MRCLECEDMACRIYLCKEEIWTGYCMNKKSPYYHTHVTGASGCNICIEQEIFND